MALDHYDQLLKLLKCQTSFKIKLRNYTATFKVRKLESLFYKINTCLQKTTTTKTTTNFCCIALLYLWAQKICLWFLKSYFKLEIIFLILCLFQQICSTKKLLFGCKKYQQWNLRHTLVEKLSKINAVKYSIAEVRTLQSYS